MHFFFIIYFYESDKYCDLKNDEISLYKNECSNFPLKHNFVSIHLKMLLITVELN